MIVVDRLITLHYYHLEANPLVNGLGPLGWIGLTVVLCSSLAYLWYEFEGWEYSVAVASVTATTILYVGVTLVNAYVILFVA